MVDPIDPDITPELLAEKLSMLTGRKLSETELLTYAHAWLALPDTDPWVEKIWLTLFSAFQALEDPDFRRVAILALEFLEELFKLTQ